MSRIDRLRSGLVAMLAHDVRNPLTAIRGNLRILNQHGERLPEGDREELLRDADRASVRLEKLATDLLDLARLEEGQLELHIEDVPLRHAIDEGLAAAGTAPEYEVLVDEALVVRADRGRLEQIVVNLASNAARYGKRPFVIGASPGTDSQVSISFADHGPGLDASQQRGMFEPFQTETGTSSVGLGLAIVRALVEAQSGEVVYEPNRPKGARFRITLPAAGSTSAG
jgi:signal transduction histidine kinase